MAAWRENSISTRALPCSKTMVFTLSFSSPRMDTFVIPATFSNRISSATFCAASQPFDTVESTVLAETVPFGMAAKACNWLCRSWRKNLFSVGKPAEFDKLSASKGEYVKLTGVERAESDIAVRPLEWRLPFCCVESCGNADG